MYESIIVNTSKPEVGIVLIDPLLRGLSGYPTQAIEGENIPRWRSFARCSPQGQSIGLAIMM